MDTMEENRGYDIENIAQPDINDADTGIIGSEEADTNSEKSKKKKRRKWHMSNRMLIVILVILAVVTVGIGGAMVYAMNFIQDKAQKVSQIDVVRTDLDINKRVAEELKDYRNILLLGIDTRAGESGKNSRSDAIIMASINRNTHDVKLVSVFRDSYLNIKIENCFDKVTHAHAYGGPAETVRTLNRNLDLNIEEVLVVDWKSVAAAVDKLGGLEVYIKPNELAELNKYIPDTYRNLRLKTHLLKRPGKHTLDGTQAVTYARIRKGTSGGDEARAERMRKLLNAALKKAKTMNIAEANQYLDEILPEIKTNMTDSDIMSMVINMNSYKVVDSEGWPYKFGGWLHEGVWYDVPITLKSNVVKLHERVFNQKNYRPTKNVLIYNQEIVNQSGYVN